MTFQPQALPLTTYKAGEVLRDTYIPTEHDYEMMGLALDQGRLALDAGDSPIGAVLIDPDGEIHLAQTTEFRNDELDGHAEMHLMRKVRPRVGRNLGNCALYTVAEPCTGCSYLLDKGQIGKLVIAALRDDGSFFRKRNPAVGMDGVFGDSVRTLTVITGLRRAEALELLDPQHRRHWINGKRG